jgi:phosphohistidine phosphatase
MKTLLIMRHAKSSWKDPSLTDHQRPLNKRGKRDAPRMGEHIQEEDLVPQHILSSSAVRAKQTVKLFIENCDFDGEVDYLGSFYFADLSSFLVELSALPENIDRVMVVGHNPDLELLLEHLVLEYARLPTATVACVELPVDTWDELSDETGGLLIDLWRPRDL